MQMNISQVYLACEISRGAFSAERIFDLETYSGQAYISVCPVYYCFKKDFSPLSKEEPQFQKRLEGLIEGRVVSNGSDKTRVSIPDGATVEVNTRILRTKT